MSKEKTVKKQAREALRGNSLPIIAGMLVFCLALITADVLRYFLSIWLRLMDIETEEILPGCEMMYFAVVSVTVVLIVLMSPFLNGMYRAAANAVIKGKNDISDVFYFFGGARRYMKTLIINMALFIIVFGLSSLVKTGLGLFGGLGDAYTVFSKIITSVFGFLFYAWFMHYPLCLYAVDDSRGIAKYIFGYIGFSFRHFGAFLKLFFSMLGWILLCFFVAPLLYVGPYWAAASINSARWLLMADEEKARQRYMSQPMYNGGNGYGGYFTGQ